VKKLVIKGLVKLGELMKEVFIISQYSHPNIVNYFSCWIERATIDEAEPVSILPSKDLSISHSMLYVESDSGFTFEKSRVKTIKRSH
jgi:hypothetical protein